MISSGDFNHAYLFSGQEMIGKRSFALELAGKILNAPAGSVSPNRFILDPQDSESGKTIGIEGVRNIKNFLGLSAFGGGKKIAVINDAHLMTHEAQNALLKILEEPSPSSMIILISANPAELLPTVVSRCQEIRFPTPKPEIVIKFLSDAKISANQADFLVRLTNGRIGFIKSILEEKNSGEVKMAIEEFTGLMTSDINSRLMTAQKLVNFPLNSKDEHEVAKKKAELQKKILYWLLFMRTKPKDARSAKILKGLLALHYKSTQPQLNQRLALESFLVNI
jgi:DNA polymerase-3 subunit delta'